MAKSVFREYLARLEANLARGRATEHSHRSALEQLIEDLDPSVDALNEPKRIECGAPDLEVIREPKGVALVVGYIEAKDVGTRLETAQDSEQLSRYRSALENLILTDYLEFRWYVRGELRREVILGTWDQKRGLKAEPTGVQDLESILSSFLQHPPQSPSRAEDLAKRMAQITHLIRDVVLAGLKKKKTSGTIDELKVAFREVLLPSLTDSQFADMFSQTLAYGLFAARVHHNEEGPVFTRSTAKGEIPKTNPFLRKLFDAITGVDVEDEPFAGLIDDLVQLLRFSQMKKILEGFGKRTRGEDPVFHFYETFLAAYDPKLRERRGVYYTPTPVVNFIVRSVHELLRREFGCKAGLADASLTNYPMKSSERSDKHPPHRVLILDPACGTGTFLYATIDLIRSTFMRKGDAGFWPGYVEEHLLPRLFGFELLMAPYAVAHLKLGMQLGGLDLSADRQKEWKYEFQGADRLRVYLTNTLEETIRRSQLLIGRFISEEADAAAEVKKDLPIMVVLGNPPYSGHSANQSPHARSLVDAYKRGYADLQRPAQAKWLQDDYVKFIRFGQQRIERTGAGILAFITNNRYLRNRTFHGMRDQLMKTFSEIYVLDLHGDSKRKDRTPGGGLDQNVFDIQQGVAIGIFVKRKTDVARARVFHSDLWGTRDQKYSWLEANELPKVKGEEVHAQGPLFLFVPRDKSLAAEYDKLWALPDLMPYAGRPAPGFVTTQDEFAISFTAQEIHEKIAEFLATKTETEARRLWKLSEQTKSQQWIYSRAKGELARGSWKKSVIQVLYRPFDIRWTVWDPNVTVHRRERIMNHIISGKNIVLLLPRTVETAAGFEHVFCARIPAQHHAVSTKEVNYIFPLYVYPPAMYKSQGRRANIADGFIKSVEGALPLHYKAEGRGDPKSTFGPEDIFAYVYAILHSTSYRERYDEFMEDDFPRIPLTSDLRLFHELVREGSRLISAHLLEETEELLDIRYPQRGGDEIILPMYEPIQNGQGRLRINKTQYFEGVPEEVAEFSIGASKVAIRWLKDRKGRKLTYDELRTFENILQAIATTLNSMEKIESAVERHGGWPLA